MHVIALPTTFDNTKKYIEQILNHPTVQGEIFLEPFGNV